MNSEISCSRPECPNVEDLGLMLDGEKADHIRAHFEICPVCKREVEVYERLDRAVRSALTPPTGLADRIKLACDREAAKERPLVMWPVMPVSRIAAAAGFAVAVGLAGVLLWRGGPQTDTVLTASTGKTAPAVTVAAAPAVSPTPVLPAPAPATVEAPAGTPVFESHDAAMSFASAPVSGLEIQPVGIGATVAAATMAMPLPNRVRHVWVVKDAATTAALIRSGLPPDAVTEKSEDGQTTIQVSLPDASLQRLVDALAGAGCHLVSPDLPQPGKYNHTLIQNRPVLYKAELVPASTP